MFLVHFNQDNDFLSLISSEKQIIIFFLNWFFSILYNSWNYFFFKPKKGQYTEINVALIEIFFNCTSWHGQSRRQYNQLNHFDSFQSGFRKSHSTESALLRVFNNLLSISDSGPQALLIVLYLSSAFGTADHDWFCVSLV